MRNNTTTLRLTAEELEVIYFALNSYSLDLIHESKTWANARALLERGGEDVFHQAANEASRLLSLVYDKSQALKERIAGTQNATL